jgi:AcrR family transcriptional regulator
MKIDRIKKAVMELMYEHGYNHTSIVLISEKSGVSTGYLYRFYSSKDELIQDVIESNMEIIRSAILFSSKPYTTVYEYLYDFIDGLFELTNSDPILGKFIAKYSHETNMPEWAKKRKDIESGTLINDILRLGRETGEINEQCGSEDIELVVSSLPSRYILMEFAKNQNKKFRKEEVLKITNMCLSALK